MGGGFMKPLISIIVPVYNVEKYIDECMRSLLNQTYENMEIILIDDESKDNSGVICDKYSERYENIHTFHKMNGGLGFARNTGLEHVQGEYVLFIDSDDYVEPRYVEKMYNNISANAADACMGGYTSVQGGTKIKIKNGLAGNVFTGNEIITSIVPLMCGRDRSGKSVQMSACMVMYKVSIIKNNEIQFPSEREFISEDLLFNISYLQACQKVICSDIVGYFYRYNPTSLTHAYLVDRFNKQKIMTSKVVEVTTSLNIYDLCEQRIANTFLGWTRACLKMEQANMRKNGLKKTLNNIEIICNDSYVEKCVRKQKIGEDRLFSVIINLLIRFKLKYILLLVMEVKNGLGV